ncbi:MAG: CDP-alcohol phosphatidyltransferase family protein [Bacteroidales bacterium]|nr:CDP-alcohol phosphatidyltransferase family protein [Bacteroidales bacterium]MDY6000694.1 CDP-alcohol phosphatidyltransferase family protein [Candidatus Cryptobacteroides sp.]
MSIRKYIPNTITCANILCGAAGIVFAFSDSLESSFIMMLAAAVFDFMDGLAARFLKAYSDFGKELDSLCDVVSFGVLPSAMLSRLFMPSALSVCGHVGGTILGLMPLLLAAFSALRLAKFNLDERQHDSFLGLPTPAAAMLCGSLAAYVSVAPGGILASWCRNLAFIPLLTVLLCALLVSEIPMFSMKFGTSKETPMREKAKRLALLAVAALSVAAAVTFGLRWTVIPIISFTVYIIINLFFVLFPQRA